MTPRTGIPPAPGEHWSDCAVHNGPALPPGPCNCGADMTEIIDHEPDPRNSQHARERHLSDLADTIVQALDDTPECWMIISDGNGFNTHVKLTEGARIVVRRILMEGI